MTDYPAQSWSSVKQGFRELASPDIDFAPMRDFVEQLAGSRYAGGLYPQKSMHTLRLRQVPQISDDRERLSVDWEENAFVVRYRGDRTAPVWTKRHTDGMIALERLFEHLRWFSEYAGPSSRPAI
ncbi:MAG: hypothetical protein ACJ79K_17175 [Gemmatimonadaceae bacterium]